MKRFSNKFLQEKALKDQNERARKANAEFLQKAAQEGRIDKKGKVVSEVDLTIARSICKYFN